MWTFIDELGSDKLSKADICVDKTMNEVELAELDEEERVWKRFH